MALEQAANGIRVNAICPGGIVTNIFGRGMGAEGEALVGVRDFMAQVLVNAQPIPRAGVPDDIAATAAFLASDGASFITGQALAVDGGMTSTNSRLMQAAANQAPPAFGA